MNIGCIIDSIKISFSRDLPFTIASSEVECEITRDPVAYLHEQLANEGIDVRIRSNHGTLTVRPQVAPKMA
jgi:hypothetical protein